MKQSIAIVIAVTFAALVATCQSTAPVNPAQAAAQAAEAAVKAQAAADQAKEAAQQAAALVPPSTAPSSPYPSLWIGAGGAYSSYSRPNAGGWMSVAKILSQTGPVYSFTTTDYTSAKSKPFTLQSSVRTGLATVIRQWGAFTLMGLGDAGAAMASKSATSTSVGSAFSGGGLGFFRFGKTGQFTVEAGARVLKTAIGGTQAVYEIGFGYIPSSK